MLKNHFRNFYDVFFNIFKERESKLIQSSNKLHPYNNSTINKLNAENSHDVQINDQYDVEFNTQIKMFALQNTVQSNSLFDLNA